MFSELDTYVFAIAENYNSLLKIDAVTGVPIKSAYISDGTTLGT